LSLIPLLRPPNETSFNDQSMINLPHLADNSVQLWADGQLLTRALANYLAARQVAGTGMPPVSQCISEWNGRCFAVLVKDEDPNNPWHVIHSSNIAVQPGSLVDSLTTNWCPVGPCGTDVINVIKDAEDSWGVLGWYISKDKSLSLILGKFQTDGPTLNYRRYDPNLHLTNESVIAPKGGEIGGAFGIAQKPATSSWSAIAYILHSQNFEANTAWSMMRSIDGARELFALLGQSPSSGERTVISGVNRADGSFCVRSGSYSGILKDLDNNWAEGKSGNFGDGISNGALKILQSSTDGTELLRALTHPIVSNSGYRISPILWMGNPAQPSNCK
jgi:hypothetical protein